LIVETFVGTLFHLTLHLFADPRTTWHSTASHESLHNPGTG
jgi:hypothetical protein